MAGNFREGKRRFGKSIKKTIDLQRKGNLSGDIWRGNNVAGKEEDRVFQYLHKVMDSNYGKDRRR